MTLYLLKVHLQTFLSITIIKKCQILSFDTLVANERYAVRIVSVVHVSYLQLLGLVCFLPHTFYFTAILYFDDTDEERRCINQELINEANYINLSLDIFPV